MHADPGRLRSPARRSRARASIAPAFLLATVLAAGPATAADIIGVPAVSGLTWRSGATTGAFPCLARLRGRALDASNLFLGPASFAGMIWATGGRQTEAKLAPLRVVSLPLLTTDTKGQFARCAAGGFDGSFRRLGANLQKAGARATVVRLGWEANLGSAVHPWGVDSPYQAPAYRACWRRAAAALKQGGASLLLEWTSAKRAADPALRVLDLNPGDDLVDLWAVHYYDSGPEKSTQALWDKFYDATLNGGPWGLGAWLAAAKQHGKKLAVSEWGVWRQDAMTAARADDPVYVANMYRFFRDHAADLAYETYFDAFADRHALCNYDGAPTSFPAAAAAAAAAYAAAWGGG